MHYKRPGLKKTLDLLELMQIMAKISDIVTKYPKSSGYLINVLEGQIKKIIKRPVLNKGVRNGKNPKKNKSPGDFN